MSKSALDVIAQVGPGGVREGLGKSSRGVDTGGVSYTVGGAAALPTLRFATPTLCFTTPTIAKFGDFLTLKRWFLTLAMKLSHL